MYFTKKFEAGLTPGNSCGLFNAELELSTCGAAERLNWEIPPLPVCPPREQNV